MKISEVFPGSERLVEGKLPPSSVLLMGPSGVGKTIFCKQFIYGGLSNGESCLYVATSEAPLGIEKSMKSFGFDVEPFKASGAFRIVDCYSWQTGSDVRGDYIVSNPGDLASLSMAIEKAMRGLSKVRVVFDSITGLTSVCNYNVGFFSRFLQVTVAKIRALDGNAIFVATPEAHDQQFISYLRQVFDGTLEMKEDESGREIKRLLRVFSLKGANHKTNWMPFEITDRGIVLMNEVDVRCVMCSQIVEGDPLVEVIGGKSYSFDSPQCVATYRRLKALYGESFE